MYSDHEREAFTIEQILERTEPTAVDEERWAEVLAEAGAAPNTPPPGVLAVSRQIRVETPSSIWIVNPDTYVRMPKMEGERPIPDSPGLLDLVEHPHVCAQIIQDWWGPRLRLIRPLSSRGGPWVVSGLIVSFTAR